MFILHVFYKLTYGKIMSLITTVAVLLGTEKDKDVFNAAS